MGRKMLVLDVDETLFYEVIGNPWHIGDDRNDSELLDVFEKLKFDLAKVHS